MRTVSAAETEGGMLHPTPRATDGPKGRAGRSASSDRRVAEGRATLSEFSVSELLPTPRATQGGSTTETGYALGAVRTDEHRAQGQVVFDTAVDFGPYQPSVDRWEAATGHPAVAPTEPAGKGKGHRLAARFCEWMMGLLAGHITATPGVSRRDAIKMAGNGVVPQQAHAALVDMLDAFATDRGRAAA